MMQICDDQAVAELQPLQADRHRDHLLCSGLTERPAQYTTAAAMARGFRWAVRPTLFRHWGSSKYLRDPTPVEAADPRT